MNQLDAIRQHQAERAQEWAENLEKSKQEYEKYLASEEYERDQWEANEERWAKKAAKEGWHYTKKPFVTALDRQRAEENARKQEIAYLKEKIAQLESGRD